MNFVFLTNESHAPITISESPVLSKQGSPVWTKQGLTSAGRRKEKSKSLSFRPGPGSPGFPSPAHKMIGSTFQIMHSTHECSAQKPQFSALAAFECTVIRCIPVLSKVKKFGHEISKCQEHIRVDVTAMLSSSRQYSQQAAKYSHRARG